VDLSSWRRVLTTQIGFVAVEVTRPARIAERKESWVRLRVGMLCSRRRFVLE
jgi:hypothetical protein